jgi:triosephosphate isomerase
MHNQKYLFANWKMYLGYQESVALASAIVSQSGVSEDVKMVVFPSDISFVEVTRVLAKARVATGAQNTHWLDKGGYTGEVSAHMYKAVGSQYALVGHSERRHLFHETNHDVRQKVEAIISTGMTPVICVGETAKEKEENKTEEVIEAQVRSAFHIIEWPKDTEIFIAYEPVWAVGTGLACDPLEAERVHELIKKQVVALTGKTPIILYGGSVNADNIVEYVKNPNISGVLVGGSSTKLESWMDIIKAVE